MDEKFADIKDKARGIAKSSALIEKIRKGKAVKGVKFLIMHWKIALILIVLSIILFTAYVFIYSASSTLGPTPHYYCDPGRGAGTEAFNKYCKDFGSLGNESIAIAALDLIPDDPAKFRWTPGWQGTEKYKQVFDELKTYWEGSGLNTTRYTNCIGFVRTVIEYAGADPTFFNIRDPAWYTIPGSLNAEYWEEVKWNGDKSKLEPGDVLFSDYGGFGGFSHTFIYIGNELLTETYPKYKGTTFDIAQAAYSPVGGVGGHAASLDALITFDGRGYKAYRSKLAGGAGTISGASNFNGIAKVLKSYGLSKAAIAGIMANMSVESGLQSNNLQNSYNGAFGLSDEEYTKKVDNGSYSKDKFIHDEGGYGLVQFTYWSYKEALYNNAKKQKKSISDVGVQIQTVMDTIGKNSWFNEFKKTNSVEKATAMFLDNYERPAEREENYKNRLKIAKEYYKKL